MKPLCTLFSILLICFFLSAQSQNLLSGKYNREALTTVIIPQADWLPFPKTSDRAGWQQADQDLLKAYISKAESYSQYKWPSIPATTSLLIERTGDRDQFQNISFEKRQVLGTLLLAEVYENKGRFLDQIIDGVWSICEESWWGASAHIPKSKEYSGLMDVSKPFVELFTAETATFLSWVDYFIGDKMDAVSPQLRKRIYMEVNNRVFTPLMTTPHPWMTTNANGRRPNNWNPWICSNWLNAALLIEKNEARRLDMVAKILNVLDQFLNPYPADGGCDEGPGYWGAAAASLYDNIALLNTASKNSFTYAFQDAKVKNMGQFIYRAQISKAYFLNFADADPKPTMAASMIYRYGKDIGDADMMGFGAYYRDPGMKVAFRFQYFRSLYELFIQDEYMKAAQKLPLPQDVWLPDIEVMVARDKAGTSDGFFIAAKGGNNDESHNHNDIGNYVVYYDGLPVLIDVGRGTYTAKTFSSKRYDIWYNRSDYHNVPTVNDKTQPPGADFKANNVSYKHAKNFAELSLDISKSYPSDADLTRLQRTIRLNRGKNVVIADMVTLSSAAPLTQHLMTCYPSEVLQPGQLVIHYNPAGGTAKDFVVRYDAKQMEASVEKVNMTSMEDKGTIQKWGDNIYRVNFKVIAPKKSEQMKFEVAVK